MGAWGEGSFDNDDALDWVFELTDATDLQVVRAPLQQVLDASEVESWDAANAIAAGEVVAALHGRPLTALPDEVAVFVEGRSASPELVDFAARAVRRARDDSELRALWADAGELQAWHATVDDLLGRLSPS